MTTEPQAEVGRYLKHYKIEALLGQGGMGVVYKARDTKLERPVAIKLLPPELMSNADRRTRFFQEARSAAALVHPSIAQVYDIDEAEGSVFIAMEFVDGKTVGRLILERELDLMGAVEISLQVAEGLAKAHEAGIIHRDIKSENIMVTKEGHAKLLDFGLAKLYEAAEPEPGTPPDLSRTMTRDRVHSIPGAVMGTIDYMSPEQARGQTLDPRSDIFSLGIVLYEMVTSELPFKGGTPIDTMHAIAYEEAKPVTIMRKNLPLGVHRIVSRCLRKRPEDRYPDTRALIADLRHLKQDLETGTRYTASAADRIRDWALRLKQAIPLGNAGIAIVTAAVAVSAVLLAVRVNWGSLIGPAIIAVFLYRSFRNRKRRMLNRFAQKIAKLPAVKAVVIKEDKATVVVDKPAANVYLRVNSLIEEINRRIYLGKHVEADIKSELDEEEFRAVLRETGVVYVREDALPAETPPSGAPGTGGRPKR
jgi:tRNA A-37 threonylcarbamoyl transferase component Bud32